MRLYRLGDVQHVPVYDVTSAYTDDGCPAGVPPGEACRLYHRDQANQAEDARVRLLNEGLEKEMADVEAAGLERQRLFRAGQAARAAHPEAFAMSTSVTYALGALLVYGLYRLVRSL